MTIDCHEKDSAALADFRPKVNPLQTRFRIIQFEDLPRLLIALAAVVGKLETNIGVSVKAGKE